MYHKLINYSLSRPSSTISIILLCNIMNNFGKSFVELGDTAINSTSIIIFFLVLWSHG